MKQILDIIKLDIMEIRHTINPVEKEKNIFFSPFFAVSRTLDLI